MLPLDQYPERFANLKNEFLPAQQRNLSSHTVKEFIRSNAGKRNNLMDLSYLERDLKKCSRKIDKLIRKKEKAQQNVLKANQLLKTNEVEAPETKPNKDVPNANKAETPENEQTEITNSDSIETTTNKDSSIIQEKPTKVARYFNPFQAACAFLFFMAVWLTLFIAEAEMMQPLVTSLKINKNLEFITKYGIAISIFLFYGLTIDLIRKGRFTFLGYRIALTPLTQKWKNIVIFGCITLLISFFCGLVLLIGQFRTQQHSYEYNRESIDLQLDDQPNPQLEMELIRKGEELLNAHLNGSTIHLLYLVLTLTMAVICGYGFDKMCSHGRLLVRLTPSLFDLNSYRQEWADYVLTQTESDLETEQKRLVDIQNKIKETQIEGMKSDIAMAEALADADTDKTSLKIESNGKGNAKDVLITNINGNPNKAVKYTINNN